MIYNPFSLKRSVAIALATLPFLISSAQERTDMLLNNDWKFRFSHSVSPSAKSRVDLPHTWNAQDALSGKPDYKRGIGNYEKDIMIRPEWEGNRLFLRFEGVNNVADVFVNGKHVGEHEGGYGAFVVEITDAVDYGKNNRILVRANNAETLDIMPLVGDFNMYGGIYRDVHLLVTEPVCISPLNYASPGLRMFQDSVNDTNAQVRALVDLSNSSDQPVEASVLFTLRDGDKTVLEKTAQLTIPAKTDTVSQIDFSVENPHLWNGKEDPFMYQADAVLIANGKTVDKVTQPLGLRYYHIDPEKGFFLNGKHLPLHGVCRHQDRAEVGNALRQEHHDEDLALMLEMGVNAARLAHYPQDEYFYDLMDKNGIIVWAEIPFVGPGGYADKGFVDKEAFRQNGQEQLKEMIRQHGNHPSICIWGIFNELKEEGDNPVEYVTELNALAHQEDPTRPTTAASNQDGALNFITDAIAWNRYDGWYGSSPATLARFLDNMHSNHPEILIGISEYGAGASIYHQQDTIVQPAPGDWWHPENWQTKYHIDNWRIISERPFVWGSFVWNMFDFGAAHRTEGDRPGINDKGLVTYDRKVKKDAFYFYKANWTQEPMVFIADRRNTQRTRELQNVIAFTNCPEAELFVNGKSVGKAKPDASHVAAWNDVKLKPGENELKVVAKDKKIVVSDSYTCNLMEN